MPVPGTSIVTRGDIVGDAMVRAKIGTGNTTEGTYLNLYLNERYQDLARAENWWWLYLYQRALIFPARYRTGTVAVTQGNATITGTGTAWTGTNSIGTQNVLAGDLFMVDGGTEIYEVRGSITATSLQLGNTDAVTVYIGTTASGLSYTTWRYLLNLPTGFTELISIYTPDGPGFIPFPEGIRNFRQMQMVGRDWPFVAGAKGGASSVQYYTIGGTEAQKTLMIWPPFDTTPGIIYFDYKQRITALTADADVPLVPLEYRDILIHAILMDYFADNDRKGDLAAYHRGEYARILILMKADQRQKPYSNQLEFRPDVSQYRFRRRTRRVWDANWLQKV